MAGVGVTHARSSFRYSPDLQQVLRAPWERHVATIIARCGRGQGIAVHYGGEQLTPGDVQGRLHQGGALQAGSGRCVGAQVEKGSKAFLRQRK